LRIRPSWVSGARHGIGKEIAFSFAGEGADIGLAEVSEETRACWLSPHRGHLHGDAFVAIQR
jgi:NAD(P)-dependent dehydrogenase (short-subunit alcohol dehydrogenase family)